jgi:aldose 1-epimerase
MEHANITPFGFTPDGTPVELITLHNDLIRCEILTLGATIRSLWVPDRNASPIDVVLGYDTPEAYCRYGGYLGATVGRFANRIAAGRFSLNGQTYVLNTNSGKHHLHGGNRGFSHRLWKIEEAASDHAVLSLISDHGDEGYPGTLKATAHFQLEGCSLILRHEAVCDQDTICSLTNHSYFNLSGHNSGPALNQTVALHARFYTPSDAENIPLGTLEPVSGTAMDLCTPGPIDTPQRRTAPALLQCGGFDHNYAIDGPVGTLRPAARVHSDATGISMDVETTLPGIQFYTGNFIYPKTIGKGSSNYGPWHGFCLETQFFPNSPNQSNFPSPVLKAGEPYNHTTIFRFSNSPA